MWRTDSDQHDAIAGFHAPVAMHDQTGFDRPAPSCLGFDVLQRFLGHAGIVFQRQGIDAVTVIALAHVHLAHEADEHRQSADALVAIRQLLELGADVEVHLLDPHCHGTSLR